MKLDDSKYKYARTLTHRGVTFAFAARAGSGANPKDSIGYSILALDPAKPDDDCWTDFDLLSFPRQLRPVGMNLLTVDFGAEEIPAADTPFQVLSDGMHVYVFRQSTTGTLLVDRFVYDETRMKLASAWEVRYRRSRKIDIPESDKDTFGATDMEGNHFIEPTTELTMVKDLQNGWFSAMILPTDLQGVSRWQLFTYETAAGKLNSFSIPRAENGLFDLSTLVRGRDGDVPPDQSFSLRLAEGSSTTDLGFATGPAALVYAKQERAKDEYGREQLVKRETRVMVAVGAVNPSSSPVGTAILDFGVGKDGKLAQVAGNLPVSPTPTIGTALAFDPLVGSAVTLPDLGITSGSAVTVEAWVRLREISSDADVVLQSAPSAALPLSLAIVGGCPQLSVSAGGRTITAQAGPIQTGFWVHLAGTWDGSTATVYVNGQPASGAGTPPPAATIGAGYILGGANGITGHLDEVRIWNVARTRAQILAAMSTSISASDPSWSTLVGYYPLNEPSDATRLKTVPNLASPSANGTLAGARWVPTSAPRGASMSPVAWDANGLTAATTLLPSVVTTSTPSLLDGSDGLIRLYYQDANQVLGAAHYDTETARAHYLVGWQAQDTNHPSNSQSGAVRFIARQSGAVMNGTQTTPLFVDVGAPDDHGLATVTLRDFTGLTETWPSVPLALDAFVAVLSGQAVQASDDTVPGDRGLVSYDYTKVTVSGGSRTEPAPGPGTGSGLFAVAADGKPDNGITALVTPTATQPPALARAGVDCWWRSDPPGAALSFASGIDHVQVLSPDQMRSYRGDLNLAGSLSLEAWINLARLPASSNAPVVFFDNPSAGAAYAFGVTPRGALFATTSRGATSPAGVIPTQQWTHVAAVYRTDYGIELSGERYLDAGSNASLSTPDGLTVEAYVKLDDTGDAQIIASKWDDDAETGWKMYVDEGGAPRFAVTSTSAGDTSTFEVAATRPLGTGQWHHVAAVYDVAKERQGAVQFSGSVSSYVQIPALTSPPTNAITVEMWVHIRPSYSGRQRQGQQIVLSQMGNPIVVMVSTDPNGYVRLWAAGSGQTSSVNVSSRSPLRYDGWSHLAVTYDVKSAVAAIYIDGIDVTSTPSTSSFSPGPGLGFGIGSEPAGSSFNGMINEVRFWNVALGVDDIRRNMMRALTGAEAGLVGYWPFKDRFGTTAMDLAGTSNGTLVDGAAFVMVDKGAFIQKLLVDGKRVATSTVTSPPDTGDANVLLGATSAGGYLQGTIDDVRLWKVGRMDWEIEAGLSQLVVNEEGLVAEWPFDDGSGRVAADAKGNNDAVLRDAAMQLTDAAANAMWVPTWFKAGWTLYVNGAKVTSSSIAAPNIIFGANQLSFAHAPQTDKLSAMIGEVRIWQGERTEEQIREGMLGPLGVLRGARESAIDRSSSGRSRSGNASPRCA
ncbi:hypothetical protein A7982_13164 [Minicystis rosea]|nr:hypothetical protein A7982_13164 [Minicystis rosea]